MFWKKACFNDQNPNISFRTRYPEALRTRRRIGNGLNYQDKENLNKLNEYWNECFDAWNILLKLHLREKKKLEIVDLDYVALKQQLWQSDIQTSGSQCPEWTFYYEQRKSRQYQGYELPKNLVQLWSEPEKKVAWDEESNSTNDIEEERRRAEEETRRKIEEKKRWEEMRKQ
jgi:hypothetical protein